MKMRMIFTENAHGIHRMGFHTGGNTLSEGSACFFEFKDVDSGELRDLQRLAAESIFEITAHSHRQVLVRLLSPELLLKSDIHGF